MAPLRDQAVNLIVRFAASIPDLELTVTSPRTSTTLSLKQLVRTHLPAQHAKARLRLIYAGKVLVDDTPLALSLRLPASGPPRDSIHKGYGSGSKSKGKEPVREASTDAEGSSHQLNAQKYYIHCSLGDVLSSRQLAAEASQAQASEEVLKKKYETSSSSQRARTTSDATTSSGHATQRRRSSVAAPAPLGFDRLLSSGFTAAEVASLRSQFLTNLSYTHTPDTMPTTAQIRELEERWLDSTAGDASTAMTGESADATTGGWGAGFSAEEGGLDDLVYGCIMGFFWPLGALIWGFREEGVWSRRRQLAVAMGFVMNAGFGFMRWSS
ncbi:hypothetical protein M011DRAFT_399570 [Sporormia fimetaria CBS 119925]|uniref:Ubiquitin-like domain-containing protein n=1 Tax=Sporormia fimetaria CBS 119925 TaxID=1340428 RepID=A0A6A6VEP5_9PLEO|nr:hypothetical protein M011DRAFT_399570 [Sporormia fimetaria CBS 119925]